MFLSTEFIVGSGFHEHITLILGDLNNFSFMLSLYGKPKFNHWNIFQIREKYVKTMFVQ